MPVGYAPFEGDFAVFVFQVCLMSLCPITLETVAIPDRDAFLKPLQEAMTRSIAGYVGYQGVVPDAREFEALLAEPGIEALHLMQGNTPVGGVVVRIDEATQHNVVELFFISPHCQNRGLGYQAWQAIEAYYPRTRVWQLVSPYFEERNIHFYVNKCGFCITGFVNAFHPYRNDRLADPDNTKPLASFFVFEKSC